jgi:hypothetical protein
VIAKFVWPWQMCRGRGTHRPKGAKHCRIWILQKAVGKKVGNKNFEADKTSVTTSLLALSGCALLRDLGIDPIEYLQKRKEEEPNGSAI